MDFAPDTVLHNRYRIIRLLGRGGMGSVYLAFDQSLEIQVAVKQNHNPSPESTNQFLREARLLASLRHPNLPRVIDYFINGQNQFLVMDYIPGEDFGSLLKKEGVQNLEKVLDWAVQLGHALTYLHSQDPPVIHRDIKPANIKSDPEGNPILVDFGIAKADHTSQATAAGATGYTPGFAPPEQYGYARTGPYSDQYALAATLYTLLANHSPADSVKRVLKEAVLTPLNLLNPNIPSHVHLAIEKGLSLRPEDRFESVDAFIRALTNPHEMATVVGIPDHLPVIEPITDPAGVTTAAIDAIPTGTDMPSAAPKTKKKRIGLILGGIFTGIIVCAISGYLIFNNFFGGNNNNQQSSIEATQTLLANTAMVLAERETEMAQAANSTPTSTQEPTEVPTATMTATPEASATPTVTPTPNVIGGGGKVAFVSNRGDGETFQIWAMEVAIDNNGQLYALNLEQLTTDEGDKFQPAWSPDGTKLLYSAPALPAENGLDIWMLDLAADPPQAVNLSQRPGDDLDPTWSPDASKIAFTNKNRWTEVLQVVIMEPDGSGQYRISGDYYEYDPVWSPDMEWLLNVIFARSHDYLHIRPWVYNEAPYATPYPTSAPYDRTQHFGSMGNVEDPAWSPDGVFLSYTKLWNDTKQIFVSKFTSYGTTTTQLSNVSQMDYEPDWAADSSWIVFTSERDGNSAPEIYIMTSTGLLQTNLTNNEAVDMQPDWQTFK
jgi:serine/threonine protein kinase/Tol biopolymer transport system component